MPHQLKAEEVQQVSWDFWKLKYVKCKSKDQINRLKFAKNYIFWTLGRPRGWGHPQRSRLRGPRQGEGGLPCWGRGEFKHSESFNNFYFTYSPRLRTAVPSWPATWSAWRRWRGRRPKSSISSSSRTPVQIFLADVCTRQSHQCKYSSWLFMYLSFQHLLYTCRQLAINIMC